MISGDILNFELVRNLSSHNKRPFIYRIGPTVMRVGTRRHRNRAFIMFDLFPGDWDLTKDAADQLRSKYRIYVESVTRNGKCVLRFPSHFSATSIWFDVLAADAGKWFDEVYAILREPPIVLDSPGKPVFVRGIEKPPLTEARFIRARPAASARPRR